MGYKGYGARENIYVKYKNEWNDQWFYIGHPIYSVTTCTTKSSFSAGRKDVFDAWITPRFLQYYTGLDGILLVSKDLMPWQPWLEYKEGI